MSKYNNERFIKDHFGNHKAEYSKYTDELGDTIERITWGKPLEEGNGFSWNCLVVYLFRNGTLSVSGDLGSAVYQWHNSIGSIKAVGRTALGYFKGKCEASEVGSRFNEWSQEEAEDCLREALEDDNDYDENSGRITWESFKDKYSLDSDELGSEYAWAAWVNDNMSDIEEYLGGDLWEWIYGVGNITHARCFLHWIGLKMAVEQLDKA